MNARRVVPAIVIAGIGISNAACRQSAENDYGIPACSARATADLLSSDALQCWLKASHGRWRILSHQEVYGALVVEVEALDLKDAEEIARRFVDGSHDALSEMSIYVQGETGNPKTVRRVRWTPRGGYETLEFTAPANP